MPMPRPHFTRLLLPEVALFLFCATGFAQVMQAPGTFPHHRHLVDQDQPETLAPAAAAPISKPPASSAAAPAAPPAPVSNAALPPSLLDKPAEPAKVNLDDGHLVVHAENSSLSEILHEVSSETGMTIDGFNRDERVFGTYGPGSPRDVLSALLDGTGYNVVMFGETNSGAPRQLTLSPRGSSGSGSGSSALAGFSQPRQQINQDDDADEDGQQVQTTVEPTSQPSDAGPAPPPGPSPTGVRTPQQMLQELQQIRQQQQQQIQQQQQQQQQSPQQQP